MVDLNGSENDDLIVGSNEADAINAGSGDDVIYGGAGADKIEAGLGDDVVSGGSGDDTIIGDSTAAFSLGAGPMKIVEDQEVTITFDSEGAGYKNTVGVYKVDPETGEIGDVEIIWANASATGSGGDLVGGESQFTFDVEAGEEIGFFLIANGYSSNNFDDMSEGSFEFVNSDGDTASLDSISPQLVYEDDSGNTTTINGNIYHSAGYDETAKLNPDGIEHTKGYGQDDSGSISIGFEDLFDGGDKDFDDIVFTVDLGEANVAVLNKHYETGTGDAQEATEDDDEEDGEDDSEDDGENLLQNGSFENDVIDSNWTSVKELDGWEIVGGSAEVWKSGEVVKDNEASDGDQHLELDGNAANVEGIYQDVKTVEGETYTLSIDIAARAGTATDTNTVEIYWNGKLVDSVDPESTDFETFSFDVTGTGGEDRLTIMESAGDSNSLGGLIDNVSLVVAHTEDSNNDKLSGGEGADYIDGMQGNDLLAGGQVGTEWSLVDGKWEYNADGIPTGGDVSKLDQSDDVIIGGDGDDVILGGGGDDQMSGDAGADLINAGTGDDLAKGGTGNDTLNMGDGDDKAYGEDGDDTINLGAGDDLAHGGAGDDQLTGGDGNDEVDGGSGDDKLFGGEGKDHLTGGSGDDYLSGGTGDDVLDAGYGNDVLDGGDGADVLNMEHGNDIASGGAGDDVINAGAGDDLAYGGDGDDKIRGGDGADRLFGNDGDDKMHGGEGNDLMDGGAGADKLFGGDGDDKMSGGAGNDHLDGGKGDDRLDGGEGTDFLTGGSGNDYLNGGAGDDKLVGGEGADVIEGGAGNDHMWGGNWSADGATDTFVVAAGGGKDMIHDFEADNDVIDLSAYGLEFSDIASLMTNKGWATEIDLSGLTGGEAGDKLIIKSIDPEDLDESNFVL